MPTRVDTLSPRLHMTQNDNTTLWVRRETHEKLESRKSDGETFDDQINELLSEE